MVSWWSSKDRRAGPLEDPEVPARPDPRPEAHVHDEHVAVEVEDPRLLLADAAELAERVDVEDEEAAVRQVVVDGGEGRLPFAEVEEVVDAVEDADHDVEAAPEGEGGHVALDELDIGELGPGLGQHLAADRSRPVRWATASSRAEDRARPAGQLEHRAGAAGR